VLWVIRLLHLTNVIFLSQGKFKCYLWNQNRERALLLMQDSLCKVGYFQVLTLDAHPKNLTVRDDN